MRIRRGIRWGVGLAVLGLVVWGVAWWLRGGTPDVIDLPPARVLLPVKVDGMWGAIDDHGEVVLAAEFDAVQPISLTVPSFVLLSGGRIALWGPVGEPTSWSLLVTQRSVTDWQYRPTWPFAKRRTRAVVEVWDADGAFVVSHELIAPGQRQLVDAYTHDYLQIGSLHYRIIGDRLELTAEPDDSYLPLATGGRLYAHRPDEQNNPWAYELTGPDGTTLGRYTADGAWIMDDATMVAAQWNRLHHVRASGESYRPNPGGVDPRYSTVSEDEPWLHVDEDGQPITPEHPVEGIDWRVISLTDGTEIAVQDVPILNRAEAPDDLTWHDVVAVYVPHLDRRFYCYVPPGREFTATSHVSAEPDEYALPDSYWVAISATHVATVHDRELSVYTWDGARVAQRTLDAAYVPQIVFGGRNLIMRAPPGGSSILMDTQATPLWTGPIHLAAQGQLVVGAADRYQIIDDTGRALTEPIYTRCGRTRSGQLTLRDPDFNWRLCTADGTLSGPVPQLIDDAVIDPATGTVRYLLTQGRNRDTTRHDLYANSGFNDNMGFNPYSAVREIWTFDGRAIYRLPESVEALADNPNASGTWTIEEVRLNVALVTERHFNWPQITGTGTTSQPAPGYRNTGTGTGSQDDSGYSEWERDHRGNYYRTRIVDLTTGEMWAESPKVARVVAQRYLYVEYWDGRIGYLRPDHTWLWPPQK